MYSSIHIAKHVLGRHYKKNVFKEHMEETTGRLLLMTSSILFHEATRPQLIPVTPPQAQSKAWDSFGFFSSPFLVVRAALLRSSP